MLTASQIHIGQMNGCCSPEASTTDRAISLHKWEQWVEPTGQNTQ